MARKLDPEESAACVDYKRGGSKSKYKNIDNIKTSADSIVARS